MSGSNRIDSKIDSGELSPVIFPNQQIKPVNHAGRTYQNQTEEIKKSLVNLENTTEHVRNSWAKTLKTRLLAPFKGIQFIAKTISTKLNEMSKNIKEIANFLLFRISHNKKTNKTTVQELIHLLDVANDENDQLHHSTGLVMDVLHAFDREMVGANYYLNQDLLLTEDKRAIEDERYKVNQNIIKQFGEEGFKNISRLLNQTITPDMASAVQAIETGAINNVGAARYGIQNENQQVRLIIEVDFSIKTFDENDEELPVKFMVARRDILIPKEELNKNWDAYSVDKTMPTTLVQDQLSKSYPSLIESKNELENSLSQELKIFVDKSKK